MLIGNVFESRLVPKLRRCGLLSTFQLLLLMTSSVETFRESDRGDSKLAPRSLWLWIERDSDSHSSRDRALERKDLRSLQEWNITILEMIKLLNKGLSL